MFRRVANDVFEQTNGNEEEAKAARERIALEAAKKAHDKEAKKEADRIGYRLVKRCGIHCR
jgi:hypothetical protein